MKRSTQAELFRFKVLAQMLSCHSQVVKVHIYICALLPLEFSGSLVYVGVFYVMYFYHQKMCTNAFAHFCHQFSVSLGLIVHFYHKSTNNFKFDYLKTTLQSFMHLCTEPTNYITRYKIYPSNVTEMFFTRLGLSV